MKRAMVAGLPFPDLYDWTWGEIADYIIGVDEKYKDELRTQASMDFHLASLISRMVFAQRGQKFNIMEEYSFLWTEEERNEIKRQNLMKSLMLKSKNASGGEQ